MFYYAIHHFGVDGGLMVTASHNPGEYNGLKMTRAEAVPIAGDSGLMDIRDLVEKREWEHGESVGEVEEQEIKEEYVKMVTKGFSAAGMKIVVDAGNGMSGYILKEVFEQLGGEVIPLYWELDGSFPNHEADPLKEENLKDLKKAVEQEKADLGVAFDGDADRVFFVTNKGETVPGDIATAIIAREVLRENPGAPVLYDIRASWTTPEIIKAAGGEPVMWKVGHSLIKAKMREVDAKFAGEVSGHFFFTPWFAESGMLAMGHILNVLQREGKSLSEVVRPLNKYVKTPELNYDVADKDEAIDRIKKKYADATKIYDFDGIRFEYQDWWASVRPSNTEPKLRLNMEAKDKDLLAEKQGEIESIIKHG
jgi:phosphomannomutase